MAESKMQVIESVASYLPDGAVDWLSQYWVGFSGLGPVEQVGAIGGGAIPVLGLVWATFALPLRKWPFNRKNGNMETVGPSKPGHIVGMFSDLDSNEKKTALETMKRIAGEPAKPEESAEVKQEAIEEAFEGDAADLIALLKSRLNEEFANEVNARADRAQTNRDIGSLLALSDVSGAAAFYSEAVELSQDEFWWRIEYGRLLGKTESIGLAWEQFGQAIRIARQNDDNREVAIANEALASCHLRLGNIEKAVPRLQQVNVDLAARAASDPDNSDWQRDLSVSHERLGDVQVSLGELEKAQGSYEAGMLICEGLSQSDPSNSEWQRDLSISHERLGDVQVRLGDLEKAQGSYDAGMLICEGLSQSDPSNSEWQRDLIVSHVKLSEVGAEPAENLRKALAIAEALKSAGKLAPVDDFMFEEFTKRLAALD